MFLELNHEDHEVLLRLVEARLSELGAEIRRCMKPDLRPALLNEKRGLVHLVHRLHEAEWDVSC